MKKIIIEELKKNYIIISVFFISIIIELIGLIAVGSGFGINDMRMFLTILLVEISILFLIKNQLIRYYIGALFLLIQGIINIFSIVLYEMTGTLFDYGMFNLRKDAMGILESIPLNFLFIFSFAFLFIVYFIFAKRFIRFVEKPRKGFVPFFSPSLLLVIAIALNALTAYVMDNKSSGEDYTQRLYVDAQGRYKELGMTSNFINELYKGKFYNTVKLGNTKALQDYLYDEVANETSHFGVSSGNNVIIILAESMEWFSFIQDPDLYPNGLNGLTSEDIAFLFPNLTSFYSSSVIMDNFYSREKTDISENLSIIGNYPSNAYINYDFPNNSFPFSLPNILKNEDENILCNSYHNGSATFYNRSICHKSLGFESLTADKTLYDLGMTNWADEGNRNLDSEMIDVAKDLMFPTDRRFFTYITSITMHGMYYERENLQAIYDKIDSINVLPESNSSNANNFRNYVAACMEFDNAIGIMMDDLQEKNLLDKTTILMFGDHNTYYQGLSNYVKGIYSYSNANYTDLYRVACMLKDPNLEAQTISKFTTTYDIVPTVLDLLGIKYYSNFYYGHSFFDPEESVLYSRAYNIFLTDKVFFYNIKKILYKRKDANSEYVGIIESKAKTLLKKLEAIDKIFYHDLFSNQTFYDTYISNMNSLNNKNS